MKRKINNYAGRNYNRDRVEDKISTERRSKVMPVIRSKNTAFETAFITLLKHKTKRNFLTHVKQLKGTPDIVFEKTKVCIFLDSDFWHGWQYPRWKHLMKNDFWRDKIEKNRTRDKKNTLLLRKEGWKVLRIWEHQIKNNVETCLKKITASIS